MSPSTSTSKIPSASLSPSLSPSTSKISSRISSTSQVRVEFRTSRVLFLLEVYESSPTRTHMDYNESSRVDAET